MIQIENLQKVQNGMTALDINQLVVEPGEIVAVVGASDSGRDILLQLLTGREQPTSGQVLVAGVDPAVDHQGFSQRAGVMFAVDALYPRQTAIENLRFHARLRGLAPGQARQILKQVGLADQARTKVDKLPGGLKRRLAYGIAVLHGPQALLLEAPFERCDETSKELLRRMAVGEAAAGKAVLILAENQAELRAFCHKIVRLDQGRVVEIIEPGNLSETDTRVPFKIPVRMEGSVVLVNPADIYYVEIKDSHTYLQTLETRLPAHYTLTELEERLSRRGFFRAHRSYLVNLQHVLEVIPFTRDSYSLRIDDESGTLIPLSKAAALELRELLDF